MFCLSPQPDTCLLIEFRYFSQTNSNSLGAFQYCGYNLNTNFLIKIFFLETAKYEDDPDGVHLIKYSSPKTAFQAKSCAKAPGAFCAVTK